MIEFLAAIFFFFSVIVGAIFFDSGEKSLCSNQFKGEMHQGKCVKVQREELK